jgi:hypothetical protein
MTMIAMMAAAVARGAFWQIERSAFHANRAMRFRQHDRSRVMRCRTNGLRPGP